MTIQMDHVVVMGPLASLSRNQNRTLCLHMNIRMTVLHTVLVAKTLNTIEQIMSPSVFVWPFYVFDNWVLPCFNCILTCLMSWNYDTSAHSHLILLFNWSDLCILCILFDSKLLLLLLLLKSQRYVYIIKSMKWSLIVVCRVHSVTSNRSRKETNNWNKHCMEH